MLRPFLGCVLLLTLGFLQFSQAQETGSKPEAPTPKTIEAPIPLRENSSSRARSEKPTKEPATVADLQVLAALIATHASGADCQPKSCNILVMNFTLPDGNTSAFGIQLADKPSTELANKDYNLKVIDRALLQGFLAKDRIPSQSIKRTVIHSIAEELDPRFMVFGTIEKFENGLGRLSSQVIDVTSKDWDGYHVNANLGPLSSGESFEPIDPFPPLPPIMSSASGEKLQRAGVDGAISSSCFYMPNPPYSEGARKLKLSGSVTVEAVVNTKGELENARIVHGMIGGVNETTLSTMRSWRCHPALKDDKPVPVLVQFTVRFQL
jgi:TonB family protein